jgi:DNA primase
MSVTQEIKNRLDIVDVVSDYGVQLRKSGRSYAGFCPFHPNTKTPAFYVFPESQTWRCFGACAEGGDVFTFVMKKNGWDFKEALADLARKAGVELEERRPQDPSRQAAEERLYGLLNAAADYYHQLLLHAPQAEAARRYVDGRALTEETVAAFRLGFSLDAWDAARSHFTGQGYREEELVRAGLLTEHEERKTTYDRFRGRLMFPIRDLDGRVVGFGARTLDPDGIPKYLNSPQTALFDKSHLIYGLDMARRYIREAREVVIVEGYMDAIQAWQAGFRNVVAQMGTALTEPQLRTLQRFSKRFILALDADAAGAKATLRGLQLARETLDRELDVGFNARGLQQLETRLKVDVRVVTLPPGNDPDKIIRADPTQWPRLLAEAKSVVEYVIGVLAAELDPADAKAKAGLARQVLPLINDIGDEVEREHYLSLLSRTLSIPVETLRREQAQMRALLGKKRPPGIRTAATDDRPPGMLTATPSKGGRDAMKSGSSSVVRGPSSAAAPAEPEFGPLDAGPPPDMDEPDYGPEAGGFTPLRGASRPGRHSAVLEAHFLRNILEQPGALTRVNAYLRGHRQPEVAPNDFSRADDRAIFAAADDRTLAGPSVASIDELCDSLGAVLAERVHTLLALPPTPETKLDKLPETLTLSVLDWRLEKLKEVTAQVKGQIESAGRELPVDERTELYRHLDAMAAEMLRIHQAKNAQSAVGRRRAEEAARRSR